MVHPDRYTSISSAALLPNQCHAAAGGKRGKHGGIKHGETETREGWISGKRLLQWGPQEEPVRGGGHRNAEIEAERGHAHALPFLTVTLQSLTKKEAIF